jgi:hypothetical protein
MNIYIVKYWFFYYNMMSKIWGELLKDWISRPEEVNESQSDFFDGTWYMSQNRSDAYLF